MNKDTSGGFLVPPQMMDEIAARARLSPVMRPARQPHHFTIRERIRLARWRAGSALHDRLFPNCVGASDD